MKKPLASTLERVAAWIIDVIIIVLVIGVLVAVGVAPWFYGGTGGGMMRGGMMGRGFVPENPLAFVFSAGVLFVTVVIAIIYTLFLEGFWKGQTIGKKVLRIRVVNEKTGKPETVTQSFIRNILRIIDNQLLGLVALVLIIFTKRKQRVGDLLAHTVVVKE